MDECAGGMLCFIFNNFTVETLCGFFWKFFYYSIMIGTASPDIQHLKYFVEVVRQESFTRAAAQLFVTQPMLTRSIKQLEESLNVLLIERTSKSFHLTDAGRILYERAQEFLMQYEAIFQTMADVRSVKTGEVRLSIPGAWWRRAPSSPPPRWDWERRIWDWSCSRWRSRPALKATFWSAMCVSLW